jgi:hypothetical protein
MRFEELLGLEAEGVGGLLERNEEAVLDREGGMRGCASTHKPKIVVMTTNVKRKELRLGERGRCGKHAVKRPIRVYVWACAGMACPTRESVG